MNTTFKVAIGALLIGYVIGAWVERQHHPTEDPRLTILKSAACHEDATMAPWQIAKCELTVEQRFGFR